MSVIVFDHEELGNIARAYVGRTTSRNGQQALQQTCDALALISQANAKAYTKTYGEDCEPFTAEDIMHGCDHIRVDPAGAMRTAQMIRYNLVANDGTDHANIDDLDWLLRIVSALSRKLIPEPD